MTVASEINRNGPYNGNGVATVFAYDFRILSDAHIQVIKTDLDGVDTALTLTTDYTVSGVGDAGGGSVTVLPAPLTGEKITLLRKMPFTQETDLENQGAYYPETIEDALDAAAMRDQQLAEVLSRAIILPASADDPGGELSDQLSAGIIEVAQHTAAIDVVAGIADDVSEVANIAGDVALLADVSGVLSGTASAVRMDEFVGVGDGTRIEWSLPRDPGVDENVLVWVGGAIQDTADYSINGATLVIEPAVSLDVKVRALIMTLVTANDVAGSIQIANAAAQAAAASAGAAQSAAVAAGEARDSAEANATGAQSAAEEAFGYAGTAGAAASAASDAAVAAAASAALFPDIASGDEGKVLAVKSDLDGYELVEQTGGGGGGGDLPAISPNSMLVSNAAGDAREEKTFQQVSEVFSSQVWTSQKYRTMKARAKDVCHLLDFITDMAGSNDDTSKVQAWLNEADACGVAEAPRGIIAVSATLYVPKGLAVLGAGQRDQWTDGSSSLGSSRLGTTFYTVGSGNAMRWTDINGSDPADDTPVFVARGNNVRLENMSVVTGMSGQPRWSMGVLIPTVRQCKLRNVSAFGFSDGALYIDATGSDKNTTLKNLHPQIEYEPGMNEFNADNCWFEGGGTAGFGIKIQGTTRAGNVVSDVNSWLWAGGGTSDIDINNTRLGSNAPSGGCYSHDAQLYDANNGSDGNGVYGRGISMNRVGFRASGGGKYCIKLDRSDGHCFIHPYAEGQNGSNAEIAITSRTKKCQQGILFLGERMISGDVTVDGVVVNSTNRRRWDDTRCLSFIRQRGEISLPNFGGGNTTQFGDAPYIVSYEPNGLIRFMTDDGTARTQRMRLTNTFLRPEVPNTLDLGDKPRQWKTVHCKKVEVGEREVIAATDTTSGVAITESGTVSACTGNMAGGSPLNAVRSNNGNLITFGRAGSTIASISVSNSTISYPTSSDARLKEDLKSIDLSLIDGINVYDFRWKEFGTRGHGVLAQEVEGLIPDLVTKTETNPEDENSDVIYGVDYSKFVPLLLATIQDLRARVAELERR